MEQKAPPKTQKEAVKFVLETEGEITSWDAFKDWGITRLAGIIFELRKEMCITSEDTVTKNRFGHTVTFSTYKFSRAGIQSVMLFES